MPDESDHLPIVFQHPALVVLGLDPSAIGRANHVQLEACAGVEVVCRNWAVGLGTMQSHGEVAVLLRTVYRVWLGSKRTRVVFCGRR